MKLNFWLKASQLFFVYVLLLLAGSLCKHVFFLLFLLCAFHAFIFAVLRYVQPPPLQLPVSSHHIRITDADDLDLPWLLQKELDWKEVLVQLSRHYSPAPSAEQRHTDTRGTCSDAAHLLLHQSHTCVPSHLCHLVVSLHPDMIHARLVVLLVSFRVRYACGESLTSCRHSNDSSAALVFCVACSKDFLLHGKDLIFINQYSLKLKRISLKMLNQNVFFVCS